MNEQDPSADDVAELARQALASLKEGGPRSRKLAVEGEVEVFDEESGWFRLDELFEEKA